MDAQSRRVWKDECMGRSMLAANLILNKPPGMLNSMVEQTYPNQPGGHPEFGSEIEELARKVLEICKSG
jgi:hypothetical protein